ncbi:MAG TPA: ABC transporter substrate-binding protein [bacterium]|nr:ABC transporter substrate-binding protein [bacterium]HOL96315.1 ABC transporter substrate-binding protein [bacterium]
MKRLALILLMILMLSVMMSGAPGFCQAPLPLLEDQNRVWDTTRPAPLEDPPDLRYGETPDEYLPYGRFTEPYRKHFLQPLQYRGYGRHIPEPEHVESVKIGFIGPIMKTVSVATGGASHEEPLGHKMLQGARLAIEQANQKGGYRGSGVPYELVIRNDNGLWGSTGNEVITLAYLDNVWAIIGSIDGANSHIAIRVALKIEIPVMNTGDTDPTFIETNIPWVFRCISDDRQMCYLLADYVYKKLHLNRVAALRANNRYGRMSIDEFRDASTRLGHPFLAELNYKVGDTDFTPQLKRIQSLNPDAVITYGDALESALILKQMREMGMNQLFIGSDRLVSPEFLGIVGDRAGEVIAGYPYNPHSTDPVHLQFVRDFLERFGEDPETYAAHAYDGTVMTIQAIEKAGLNRALIRDELARVATYHGVTGVKIFDPIFNNISPAYLARLENGEFKFYSREDLGLDKQVTLGQSR